MSQLEAWERRPAPVLTLLAALSLLLLVVEAAFDMKLPLVRGIDYATWAVFAADFLRLPLPRGNPSGKTPAMTSGMGCAGRKGVATHGAQSAPALGAPGNAAGISSSSMRP
jgi:hypothetical protein